MSRIRVHNFCISLDGFGAAPDQSLDHPIGVGGGRLHDWIWQTQYGRSMIGEPGGSSDTDDQWLRRGDSNVGATVMGRNMFGPIRGEWPDDSWRGWWGDEPPYQHAVFVLTHYARRPLEMTGTTFHFVTDGLESALEQAVDAAAGADVRIGGGVACVREALRKGLVDELHVSVVPVLFGAGERLWENLGTWPEGYHCAELEASSAVAHVRFERD